MPHWPELWKSVVEWVLDSRLNGEIAAELEPEFQSYSELVQ